MVHIAGSHFSSLYVYPEKRHTITGKTLFKIAVTGLASYLDQQKKYFESKLCKWNDFIKKLNYSLIKGCPADLRTYGHALSYDKTVLKDKEFDGIYSTQGLDLRYLIGMPPVHLRSI